MKPSTIIWIVVAILVIAGGWYLLSRNPAPAPAAPATTTDTTGAATAPAAPKGLAAPTTSSTYVAGNLLLGVNASGATNLLVADNGMTLYTYNKDTTPGSSSCTGNCAVAWPPYLIASRDQLSFIEAGVGGAVTAINRADGKLQVAYNGKPLYFWKSDVKPGDATGDNVNGFFIAKP